MGPLAEIWQKIIGKPNPLDKLVYQMFGQNARYPEVNSEFYLDSYCNLNDVFTVINKKNEPASTVPIYQYKPDGNINESGQMIARLNKPNPYQSRSQFIEAALTYFDIFGENFTAVETIDMGVNAGKPGRLDHLPPKYTEVIPGTVFNPVAGYSFLLLSDNGKPNYDSDQVLHWKEFNPDYDLNGGHLRGLSRMRGLIRSIIGTGEAYNSLVKAFQSQGMWGIVTMLEPESRAAINLTKEQKSKLRSEFKKDAKKGDLTISNAAVEYTKMGLTVVELEILKALSIYKGNLCDAYNVPSQLLSGSQDRTYNNYKEAEQSLWRNAIQPCLDAYLESLSNWLAPKFGEEGQVLKADYSNVSCLQTNKVELTQWMIQSQSFTRNEIREALGYEVLSDLGMDEILVSAGMMPIGETGNISEPQIVESVMKSLKISDYR